MLRLLTLMLLLALPAVAQMPQPNEDEGGVQPTHPTDPLMLRPLWGAISGFPWQVQALDFRGLIDNRVYVLNIQWFGSKNNVPGSGGTDPRILPAPATHKFVMAHAAAAHREIPEDKDKVIGDWELSPPYGDRSHRLHLAAMTGVRQAMEEQGREIDFGWYDQPQGDWWRISGQGVWQIRNLNDAARPVLEECDIYWCRLYLNHEGWGQFVERWIGLYLAEVDRLGYDAQPVFLIMPQYHRNGAMGQWLTQPDMEAILRASIQYDVQVCIWWWAGYEWNAGFNPWVRDVLEPAVQAVTPKQPPNTNQEPTDQ